MKSISKSYKNQLILFFIAFLLCSGLGGALENAQLAIARQVGFHTPHAETIPSGKENYSSDVHIPFVLADFTDAHRLVLNRIFSSSGKEEKAKKSIDLIVAPSSIEQGNAMCGFGTWKNAISRSLVVFTHHIVISYIHLQDGLK